MNDRWKRGTFPFKTLFHLSRYHFRFPRYRRAKQRVIFNRSLFLSLSLIRTSRSHLLSLTYLKLQTSDRRDSRKNVVRASKIYRSIDGATIHIFSPASSTVDTLNRYISATDWDIRIRQKGISMARFPLFSERVLTTYFPCIGWIF